MNIFFYISYFQEEEKRFIATLAENSAATEEELLQTIKNCASGECLYTSPWEIFVVSRGVYAEIGAQLILVTYP